MKKEFLIELGVAEDIAAKIMEENGKDIQHVDRKLIAMTTERDTLKTQIEDVGAKLKAFDGVDAEKLNGEITRLSGELADAQTKHTAELAKLARSGETKDFLTTYKFINDVTRDYYANEIEKALDNDANKGKSRKDILDALVNGEDGKPKPNIFASPENPNPIINLPPIGPVPPGSGKTATELMAEANANPARIPEILAQIELMNKSKKE